MCLHGVPTGCRRLYLHRVPAAGVCTYLHGVLAAVVCTYVGYWLPSSVLTWGTGCRLLYLHGVLAAGIRTEQLTESSDAGKTSDDLVTLNLVPQGDVERRPENLPEQEGTGELLLESSGDRKSADELGRGCGSKCG